MRTTLDIDADVLIAAKERARLEGKTVGKLLSKIVRDYFTRGQQAEEAGDVLPLLGVRPFPRRGTAPVTTERVRQIMDEEGI